MHLPSLELIDDCHIYISGEVVVHPSAAISAGVLLQADPGSQLIVAAGVCIGSGAILHAHQGILEVEANVTLGSGVLIVGHGKIGESACIGAMTTVLNQSIEPRQMIAPGSLIGDLSRQISVDSSSSNGSGSARAASPLRGGSSATSVPPPEAVKTDSSASASQALDQNQSPQSDSSGKVSLHTPSQVYGQAYLERIMITMFPHRQALESADSSESSPPHDP